MKKCSRIHAKICCNAAHLTMGATKTKIHTDVSTLQGFKVGTLKQTEKIDLSSLFGFDGWVCEDLETCLKDLAAREK